MSLLTIGTITRSPPASIVISTLGPTLNAWAVPPTTPNGPPPTAPAAAAGESQPAAAKEDPNVATIKSPMVGTFYRSASPDSPAFTDVGAKVGNDSVVCIIEAMKLFNEIEAEVSGKIVKIIPTDSSPVEYGQVLMLVEPS